MITDLTKRGRAHLPKRQHTIEIPEITLHQMLDDVAKEFGDRIALDFLGRKTSYSKLADRVRRAAGLLYNLGVRRGDVVALVMPNCAQHMIAFFAIQRLGAIAAEHNPLAPTEEIQDQLRRHGGKVVIAWEKALEQVCPNGDLCGRQVLSVDLTKDLPHLSRRMLQLPLKRAKEMRAQMRGPVPAGVGSFVHNLKRAPYLPADIPGPEHHDVAVYLHTGGTTGAPKTVPLTHRNLVAQAKMGEAWLPPTARGSETFAAILPYFHAFGMMLSLVFGVHVAATQVVFPRFDVDLVLSAQRRRPMTFVPGVPPIFDRIAKAAKEKGRDLTSINVSLAGAMPLDAEVAKRWEDITGGLIIEGYGMTETSPVILGNPISEGRRPGTLGVVFPSTQARIVDQDDLSRDVEPGELGELLIKGPQVFDGYLNAPEETKEAFTDDGWLRTGDVVFEDDGFVTLADRRKELIISGGFNIYPSQVEETMRDIPGVMDVAVVGVPSGAIGEKVVAALVLEAGARVDLEAVRAWCDKKLSHYAIPRQIEVLQELPKSQIGKILRRKVKEQIMSGEKKDEAITHPTGNEQDVPQDAAEASAENAAQYEGDVKDGKDL